MKDEETALTIEDLNEFLSAKTYEEQFEILLKHAEKNQKIIEMEREKDIFPEQGKGHAPRAS